MPAAVDSRSASLLESALASGECLTADGRIPWAPASLRECLPGGSVAVVPAGSLALALVREDHAPFVLVELERLAALMRVAARDPRAARGDARPRSLPSGLGAARRMSTVSVPAKKRILIVEDETIIRLDLRSMLETAGYEVCGEAADGVEAIELAASLEPT